MKQAYIKINGVYRRVNWGYARVSDVYKKAWNKYIRVSDVYKEAAPYTGGGTFSVLARSATRTYLVPPYTFYAAFQDRSGYGEFTSSQLNRVVGTGDPRTGVHHIQYGDSYSGKDTSGRPVNYPRSSVLQILKPADSGNGDENPPLTIHVVLNGQSISSTSGGFGTYQMSSTAWKNAIVSSLNKWVTLTIPEFTYN